ncbi:MAG: recombinase family protein [Parasporobacterium sp.]|nr:recombinase family protein [Parasporobacterium sp.]
MFSFRKDIYHTAVYLRLSREDDRDGESDSIQNQRFLIREFLNKHPDLKFKEEFVDDGYSGTNQNRPGFLRMMQKIENKEIDCVIVKDLSRLGRNYIETGRLLRQYFPEKGVRFIAVNDNYDSIEPDDDMTSIIVPFKTIINDAYSRDISIKISTSLDAKRREGKFVSNYACYGYKKDLHDKNHIVIDDYAAGIVKMIYDMKFEGYSEGRIAQKLNEMKVLAPAAYKRSCGNDYNSGWRMKENPKWYCSMVRGILTNEIYTGTMVQGKRKKINYMVKKLRPVEKENWIRVPKTHEAIIDKERFDTIQELMKIDTRTAPEREKVGVLSGLVRCADCGENMVIRSTFKKGKQYLYYHCSTAKRKAGCTHHLISKEKLETRVLAALNEQIEAVMDLETYLKDIDEIPLQEGMGKTLMKQIQKLYETVEKYTNLKTRLYVDLQDGLVSREDYQLLHTKFAGEILSAMNSRNALQEELHQIEENAPKELPWIDLYKRYQDVEAMTRQMAISLIQQIDVYDKNHVEIRFRFSDEIRRLRDAVAQEKEAKEECGA